MARPIPPRSTSGSHPNGLYLWIARILIKLLKIPEPPENLASTVASGLHRFGGVLVVIVVTPPICAFILGTLDRLGASKASNVYRDYVVSGFGINESIYKADKERIDYLLQLRKVDFLDDDEVEGEPWVVVSIIPRQQGRIYIERADLIQRSSIGRKQVATSTGSSVADKCPNVVNPRQRKLTLVVTNERNTFKENFEIETGNPFDLDDSFWNKIKIDDRDSGPSGMRSIKISFLPKSERFKSNCFSLFVDFRIEIYKTRSLL